MARPEKVEAVTDIGQRFTEAASALLTEYRGLSVGDMAQVRAALRDVEADYKVVKNTLTRIAVTKAGLDDLTPLLVGPTAIAFCRSDAAAAAKALDEATSRFPVLVVKGGILNGKVISADQVRALGRLEPREVQLAKIAMVVNSPLQQLANVFSALLRDLGSMLAQLIEQQGAGAASGAGDANQGTTAEA